MNGKDLLISLGNINPRYYEEAENGTVSPQKEKHRSLRRPLLVAAIVALMLLLVGCAVVYAMRLQDMSIGQETYTQTFDEQGKYLDEPVEKTRDLLTMYGHSGDPVQKALTEWYDFLNSYDPERELLTNETDLSDIPNQYEYTYGCYTPEMVDKLNEIAATHGLKLLDEFMIIQRWQSEIFLESAGIGDFLTNEASVKIENISGIFYPPYNFHMEFELILEDNVQGYMSSINYTRKDYLPVDYSANKIDLDEVLQWDHTAPDGTKLLLVLRNKGSGYIIAEPPNAILAIHINGNRSNSLYPDESQRMTADELEAIADQFNYSICPGEIDLKAMSEKLDDAEAAHWAEQSYEPETYSGFTEWLMGQFKRIDPDMFYTFYDLTGDGEDELLISENGYTTHWLTRQEGTVLSRYTVGFRLCENRIIEVGSNYDAWHKLEEHAYYAPFSDTAIVSIDQGYGELLDAVAMNAGQWFNVTDVHRTVDHPITEEAATSVIAKYHPLQLDWRPLSDYPLDVNGNTLGEYYEEIDLRVSENELIEIYIDHLKAQGDKMHYTHYRLLDVNNDGVKDFLVSGDGSHFWNILTYRYGSVMSIRSMDFMLCGNGVLERFTTHSDYGVETEYHRYIRLDDFEEETVGFVGYCKATDAYEADYAGTPMDAAEANAILAKYPRIDQGMRPISELLN